ncbi:MAG: SAF domain-containing protein [Acidimicrobiales bacterium]|nr:SAF domain-containing protein [Acidimicrobiales bacterium]
MLFWFLAGLAAVSTFAVVSSALKATTAGADAYGDLVEVVVASSDLGFGHVIDTGDTELASVPASMVPTGAVDAHPVGRTVRHPILAGEAVASERLAPGGSVGVAALLEPGERAVAIPMPAHRSPFEVGQVVDVLATTDPSQARGRSPTSLVADGAVVVAVDDAGITVATSQAGAERLATALSYAVISVAIRG